MGLSFSSNLEDNEFDEKVAGSRSQDDWSIALARRRGHRARLKLWRTIRI
jgi:hypothetical protein